MSEQPQVDRAPLMGPRSVDESWSNFKDSVLTTTNEGVRTEARERESEHVPKNHVDLAKLTPKQQEHWQKTSELPESKEESREGQEPSKANPATEGESDTKQATQQHEATQDEGGQRSKEAQPQTLRGYERVLEMASRDENFDGIVERLTSSPFPNSADGFARMNVLAQAVSEITNVEQVVYELAHPRNSSLLLEMQDANPNRIAAIVHKLSAQLRFGGRTAKSEEATRPRLPRLGHSEVGGRAASHGDSEAQAVKDNDFARASALWDAKLRNRGR